MALRRKPEEETGPRWLDVNASMTGTLSFKDPVNLQINGQFDGSLDAKGNLSIGPQALVKATIQGEAISIAGKVEGTITATQRLELLASARVTGKVITPKLVIQDGAVFDGTCEMSTRRAEAQWMNLEELARYLEVEQATILEWAQSGRLPAQRENNQWRFERARIEEWLAQDKFR